MIQATIDLSESSAQTESATARLSLVENQRSINRARRSRLYDCPPMIRVYYSPRFEPDCGWVCGHKDGPKRLTVGDDDEGIDTRNSRDSQSRTRDEEDQMNEEDKRARAARVTDADGGTPTRSRRQPETRATASDDDDGMPSLRLIRQSGEAAPAGRN